MKIAVASSGLNVAARFEYAESYTCYLVERGIIVDCQNIPNLHVPYNNVAQTLASLGIKTVIVGAAPHTIGSVFQQANIEIIAGAEGGTREAVEQYLTSILIPADDVSYESGGKALDTAQAAPFKRRFLL